MFDEVTIIGLNRRFHHKGFVNTLLVVVIVAFVGVGLYLVFAGPITLPLPLPSPGLTPTPVPNGETIVKTVGEQEGSFLIQKILPDRVEGLWYQAGRRVAGVVQKTSRIPVTPTRRMVQLVLEDGRELLVSPGHPTIDGRRVGDLTVGEFYDDARVVTAEGVVNGETATYDILPSGETGFYWADGILLDSTLH